MAATLEQNHRDSNQISSDNEESLMRAKDINGDSKEDELNTIPKERSRSTINIALNSIKEHVMGTKHKKQRLLGKHGTLKVKAFNTDKTGIYFSDLFTTLVDADWKWIIILFSSSYVGSWLVFALLWFAVAESRDPFECLDSVDSFPSALLLSIETQTTIGYGGRSITPSCPDAIIILIAQSLIGLLMSAFLLGLVFTKLARPSRRADTLLFSKNSVIAPRDGKLCLLFRVGDIRESRILDAQIRVQLFRTRRTAEGHDIPFYQQDLKCGIDWSDKGSGNNSLFLILPLTIVHVIDEESPFYEMGPEDFNPSADFEVVAILSGTIESTSMLVEARSSYLGDEIFWGRDFAQVLDEKSWDRVQGRYLVDFSRFHSTIPVELPQVPAKEFYQKNQEDDEVHKIINTARTASRRIISQTPRQEGLVKRYTELWKKKFTPNEIAPISENHNDEDV